MKKLKESIMKYKNYMETQIDDVEEFYQAYKKKFLISQQWVPK